MKTLKKSTEPLKEIEPKQEGKEGFWLRFRTFIFQFIVVIGVIMLIGLVPSPANIWLTMLIVAVVLGWKKIFKKKDHEL